MEGYHREIDGVPLSINYNEDVIRSVLDYRPQRGDVFIASYPKCGTTWMQQIVYNILTGASGTDDCLDFFLRMPFLEKQGADSATYGRKPGALKTHLQFGKTPYSVDAKYVYITRNPYDCCVSYYYHYRNFPNNQFADGTFDEFFEMFVRGRLAFGDYFDHLVSWYEHRNDPNVLFLTYEAVKSDTKFNIIRIAEFLGQEHGKRLREDSGLLNSVYESCTRDRAKKMFNVIYRKPWKEVMASFKLDEIDPRLLKGLQAVSKTFEKPMTGDFVRRGVVGDWGNHFSDVQIKRMQKRIEVKTKGSDVMSLWREECLP